MTDTEFADTAQALGVAKGRIEAALELCEWAMQHPAILTSEAAHDMARDLVAKCQQIIKHA